MIGISFQSSNGRLELEWWVRWGPEEFVFLLQLILVNPGWAERRNSFPKMQRPTSRSYTVILHYLNLNSTTVSRYIKFTIIHLKKHRSTWVPVMHLVVIEWSRSSWMESQSLGVCLTDQWIRQWWTGEIKKEARKVFIFRFWSWKRGG